MHEEAGEVRAGCLILDTRLMPRLQISGVQVGAGGD
jgi:hypothetical protein